MRREYGSVMTRVVDRQSLTPNTGLSWIETVIENMDAQDVTETTDLDNFQQYEDAKIAIEPAMIGIATFITDKAKRRLNKKSLAQVGQQPQNAIERRKDTDGLAVLDTFTSLGGAGTTLTAGHIRAAAKQNGVGGGTEEWDGPQATVLHGYQVKDLEDEIVAGIGTYNIPNGLSESVYKTGFKGLIADTEVFVDNKITIDASDDAKGGTFARGTGGAIVLVQGMPRTPHFKYMPEKGGGGEAMYMYDEYKYGVRQSSWGKEIYSDAATPTS